MRVYVLFYYATSGGSLEFALVFVSVVFAFAECGMWNVECGDGGIFINPPRVCKFRKGKLLLSGCLASNTTNTLIKVRAFQ